MSEPGLVRTLLVEDEAPARRRLRSSLEEHAELEIVGEAADGIEALNALRSEKPDLVFLDVQMPRLNGIEVIQQLEEKPHIIFTTAYDEYAIQAFELHAIDYLLKPYGRARLREAVERAIAQIGGPAAGNAQLEELLKEYRKTTGYLQRICVQDKFTYRVVDVDSVDCFKADEGLVFLLSGDEHYIVDASLTHLEGQLDPARFFRVHRNAIVNLDRVQKVIPWGQGKLTVGLPGGKRAFVSRSRVHEFKRKVGLSL